ncbi:hypothetical protein [Deinococcus wulumuqiensis]|uniref:hypothetical protein n=1 Tax=Deinococcus wulumuqiensis TaxID=980427 RepID=UPI00242F4C83|nr:hypothetical protein [Deinococcus wulumuqiensis]
MKIKALGMALLGASLLAACGGDPAPAQPEPEQLPPSSFGQLSMLKPGELGTIEQKLKVNIVNIGYAATSPGQVTGARDLNFSSLRQELPATYKTINRYPSFYGNNELTGNNFIFDYNYVTAPKSFEDEFFAFLASSGKEDSLEKDGLTYLNIAAAAYNCQSADTTKVLKVLDRRPADLTPLYACPESAGNIAREITGNWEVDGAAVEKWLGDNAGKLGIDPTQHTVFLINWYGRPDFKFHSYSHERAESVESDTKLDFGQRSSRRTVAWGGTPSENQASARRIWFYDQSANPDYWTNAWNVSSGDLDGDKVYDKRMLPIWEYGTRKASYAYGEKISADLGKVVRYVAVDLLFTPSALYRVALTPPDMPEHINVDLALEQGADAPVSASVIKPQLVEERLKVLNPFVKWSTSLRETALDGDVADAYKCFFPLPTDDACSPDYADPEGERFFQLAQAEIRQRAQAAPGQYQLTNYLFNDTNAKTPNQGLLGQAISDGVTGTQTLTLNFLTPGLSTAGYGFTDTVVHESGHHLSQSHPHDGYDSERDEDFGPSGDTAFVDVGDEVHSVMSYNNLSKTFGQFNLDAQYRYLTTAYLTNSNAILQLVRNSAKVPDVRGTVQQADQTFLLAQNAYQQRHYLDAADLAHRGYQQVLGAARAAGVPVEGYKWYDRIGQLSTEPLRVARKVNHMRPVKGPVQRPEETSAQREKRLAP